MPTPSEPRDELQRLAIADLRGPAGGPQEAMDESHVRDRYLVGRLAPRGARLAHQENADPTTATPVLLSSCARGSSAARETTMRITCLVDNTVSGGSLWGEHGLAFLIECDGRHVLMDTGASGAVLLHNMEALGLDLGRVEALAISHGHHDHTGGLQALLGRREGLPLYAHPAFGEERVSRGEGRERSIGLPFRLEDLAARADLRLSPEPQEIVPGVWTTGQIRERPEPEGRVQGHLVRRNGTFVDDPYDDDMGLVLEWPGGRVLLLGCCHAGLLNTIHHVHRRFGGLPTHVVGGTHLSPAPSEQVDRIADALKAGSPPRLYPNHCTGMAAYCRLAAGLGDLVAPFPAGTVLEL